MIHISIHISLSFSFSCTLLGFSLPLLRLLSLFIPPQPPLTAEHNQSLSQRSYPSAQLRYADSSPRPSAQLLPVHPSDPGSSHAHHLEHSPFHPDRPAARPFHHDHLRSDSAHETRTAPDQHAQGGAPRGTTSRLRPCVGWRPRRRCKPRVS